jgi:hypothetical protein
MKVRILLFVALLTGLYSCNTSTDFPVLDRYRAEDAFARNFIGDLITGNLDSCFEKVDHEKLTDSSKLFLENASRNLKGAAVKNVKIIEEYGSVNYDQYSGKSSYYHFGYQYELEPQGYVLFFLGVTEKKGKLHVTTFNGRAIAVPVDELTKFTMSNRSTGQYIFFALTILIPVFILVTFIAMLLSKMKGKKKVGWSFIILFVALPRFIMNWGTGKVDFNLFNLEMFGGGFSRASVASYWLLYFHLPIGAFLFWYKRKRLIPVPMEDANEPNADSTSTNEESTEKRDENLNENPE